MESYVVAAIIVLIIIILLCSSIKVVPQANAWVVEFLGKYHTTWLAGIHFKAPIIYKIAKKVSLKEQVADFEPQPVITKDNVTMMVDSVVFFEVFDAKLFSYGVERPIAAIENLSATTLRNIIGSMTLDETLTSRDSINGQITTILDDATDKWGIKVNRVEVKNIQPPRSIQDAMEKQMRAEREKREAILTAEGKKQSAITLAEGEKEAAILRADAIKEQRIREAQGEAEAIKQVAEAKAEEIISKIKKDKNFKSKFEKDPVNAVESVLGIDLPDDIVNKIIDFIKTKLTADAVGDVTSKLGGLFNKK